MDTKTPLQIAERLLGIGRIAKICKVSREAARKWVRQGFLPRTEWTGETNYSSLIADDYAREVADIAQMGLEPTEALTAEMLLSVKPTARHGIVSAPAPDTAAALAASEQTLADCVQPILDLSRRQGAQAESSLALAKTKAGQGV